jgi:hypothetical protein
MGEPSCPPEGILMMMMLCGRPRRRQAGSPQRRLASQAIGASAAGFGASSAGFGDPRRRRGL